MEILVVEDDERMAALLKRGLDREGHVTTVTRDGAEGLDFALAHDFDVVILDVMLPVFDGFELARRLREHDARTPILMLTARDTPSDIVNGLDIGADDYLTKPFAFDELLARVRAVSRRGPIPIGAPLTVGDLKLDPASHDGWRGERKLRLTKREYQVLELLARRAGGVVSRDAIIEGVWGHAAEVEHNTVDVFIANLRKKLNGESSSQLIHTVRGVGFCLRPVSPGES